MKVTIIIVLVAFSHYLFFFFGQVGQLVMSDTLDLEPHGLIPGHLSGTQVPTPHYHEYVGFPITNLVSRLTYFILIYPIFQKVFFCVYQLFQQQKPLQGQGQCPLSRSFALSSMYFVMFTYVVSYIIEISYDNPSPMYFIVGRQHILIVSHTSILYVKPMSSLYGVPQLYVGIIRTPVMVPYSSIISCTVQ